MVLVFTKSFPDTTTGTTAVAVAAKAQAAATRRAKDGSIVKKPAELARDWVIDLQNKGW